MKKRLLVGLALMALSLFGCSRGNENITSSSDNQEYTPVSKTVGASGGTITDSKSGLSLQIPAGALDKDTTISIQYVIDEKKVAEDPTTAFLGAVEFAPSGLVFDRPVQVSINLKEAPTNSSVSAFCYDEDNKIWDFISSASVDNTTATFDITHFSKYQCIDITEAMYSKYIDLVHQAQDEGKSDSWITNTYKDYLVDEKHVMDYYQEFNGYFYEPVGLFIGGQYQLDGKQGNGDELVARYGNSNKVGNTYGYSKVGGKTVSYAEAKKEMGKTTGKQNVIDVTLTLDYKMIKPTIDLTASKTTLKKGESTQVNVYCHYAKQGNVIYPDFPLPNYKLKIETPTHLSIDKKEVTTNESGKSSFIVTSKDSKADSIMLTFDVIGDFGTHSEGTISFSEEGKKSYSFSAHVSELHQEDFDIRYGKTGSEPGYIKVSYEYDMEGSLSFIDEYQFKGTISYKNITVNVEAKKNEYTGNGEHIIYRLFDSGNSIKINPLNNVGFSGSYYSDYVDLSSIDFDDRSSLEEHFIEITSQGYWYRTLPDANIFEEQILDLEYNVYYGVPFYSGFMIEEGTKTVSGIWVKDSGSWHTNSPSIYYIDNNCFTYSGGTTETLTFTKTS